MTINLYVSPGTLPVLIEAIKILEKLPIDNDYYTQPLNFNIDRRFTSNWVQVSLTVNEYEKLVRCLGRCGHNLDFHKTTF